MKSVVAVVAVAVAWCASWSTVEARLQYKKAFEAKYVKKDSNDPTEKTFAAAYETAKCLVCHGKNAEGKEDKKVRNSFGAAFGKIVGKNQKDTAKIDEALDKVVKEKSDPDNASSPTFGDLIKEGKLPAGDK